MNNPTILYAGIDVAKSSFQLHWRGASHQLPNNPKGHARLLALLGGPAHNHVVMEATGGYERPIASALRAGGYRLSVVEPGRVRAFARAQGLRAKNDPIDAAVIGAFGQAIEPAPTPAPSPEQERLAELVTRRAQLVNMKVAETNHREHYRDALAQRQAAALLRTLAGQIAQMEKEIARLLAAAAPMQARADRIQQVPGVGPIVAATLQAYMPELGTLSAASAAALAGVAPYDRQSGPWVGQRRISGGPRAGTLRALPCHAERRAARPRVQGHLHAPAGRRQKASGRADRGHAQTHRPAQPLTQKSLLQIARHRRRSV